MLLVPPDVDETGAPWVAAGVVGEAERERIAALLDEHLVAEPPDPRLGHLLERTRLCELDGVGQPQPVDVEVRDAPVGLVELAVEAEAEPDVGHGVGVDRRGGEERRRQQRAGGEQEHQRPVRREPPQREPPDGEEFAHAASLGTPTLHGHGAASALRAASERIHR